MPQTAGNGRTTLQTSIPLNRQPSQASQTEKPSAKKIETMTLTSRIDAIGSNKGARNVTPEDQIPIAPAYTATYRIASAVSSTGACPSPTANRRAATYLSLHAQHALHRVSWRPTTLNRSGPCSDFRLSLHSFQSFQQRPRVTYDDVVHCARKFHYFASGGAGGTELL